MKFTSFSFSIITLTVLISSCTSKEKLTKLQTENDSLANELATSQKMLVNFQEVGSLLDTIDNNRNALHINMIEGTTYADYTSRLEEINSYVKKSQQKIDDLELLLKDSRHESSAYQMMIMALKDELSIATDEIRDLEERVTRALSENKDLKKNIKLKDATLADFQLQLDVKYQEVKLFENHIQELTNQLKITEADAYFTRAQALELAAQRTKLAPRKKRETYREALEFYKKAHAAGHTSAKVKIAEIEKRI
ncbi:MAG: hypothetical protein L0Y35_04635 [Flammeovirgaceae bacterium]|nr:hypothetical protein [Flammeovirgaceae bacterium]